MDVTITNNSTAPIFIPGPNVEVLAGASVVIPDVSLDDIDDNVVIKAGIVAGTLVATAAPSSEDAAKLGQSGRLGIVDPVALQTYTVATLPATGNFEGQVAFATNGRKTGEGPGVGTGVPVYWSAAAWHVYFDDSVVAA